MLMPITEESIKISAIYESYKQESSILIKKLKQKIQEQQKIIQELEECFKDLSKDGKKLIAYRKQIHDLERKNKSLRESLLNKTVE